MQNNQTRSFEACDYIDNSPEIYDSCVLNSSASLMHDSDLEDQSKKTFRDDGVETRTLKDQLKITNDMVVAALTSCTRSLKISTGRPRWKRDIGV